MSHKNKQPKPVKIRAMKEDEMLDSVYREKTVLQGHLETVLVWVVSILATALLIAALYYFGVLTDKVNGYVLPYLWMIPDRSGYLAEFTAKLFQLLVVIVLILCFGFALDINFTTKTRPPEKWKLWVKIAGAAAFGADILFAVAARITGQTFLPPSGGAASQFMYYLTKLLLVPVTNILLYLVLPTAAVKMLLILIAERREKAELPLILAGTVFLTLGMLGFSWNSIQLAGIWVGLYALIQGAACSVIYHRTNTLWRPIFLCFGVTGLYYLLAWGLSLV